MPEKSPTDNLVPFETFKKKLVDHTLDNAQERMDMADDAYREVDDQIAGLLVELDTERSKPIRAQNRERLHEIGERLIDFFAEQDTMLDAADEEEDRIAKALAEKEKRGE